MATTLQVSYEESQNHPASSLFEKSSYRDSSVYTEKGVDSLINIDMENSDSNMEIPVYREDSGYLSYTIESHIFEQEPYDFAETSIQFKNQQETEELTTMMERQIEHYTFEAATLDYFADNPEWLMEYSTLDFSFYMV